jgi:uncharacterized protein YdbL (DUF1318 family)
MNEITVNKPAYQSRSWLVFLTFLAGLLFSGSALALELDVAKSQGLVGERADGYLGVVVESPSAEVTALVETVNAKRRARYQQIASKNNIDLADVEARAGQRAIQLTASGGWFFQARWEQKP